MSPYREACMQLEKDQRYQAFLDWARTARVTTLLWHAQRLMCGDYDTFTYPPELQQRYLDLSKSDGWSTVLLLIAQVQKEKEQTS